MREVYNKLKEYTLKDFKDYIIDFANSLKEKTIVGFENEPLKIMCHTLSLIQYAIETDMGKKTCTRLYVIPIAGDCYYQVFLEGREKEFRELVKEEDKVGKKKEDE